MTLNKLPENHAYRVWILENNQPLKSIAHNTYWNNATMVALCNCCGREIEEPSIDGQAGMYSHKSLKHLIDSYGQPNRIFGIVFNHGTVVEGTSGYRSGKSTIRVLFCDDWKQQDRLKQYYPEVTFAPVTDIVRENQEEYAGHVSDMAYQRRLVRQQAIRKTWATHSGLWPLEQKRVADILKGKTYEEILAFAKEYARTDEWVTNLWPGVTPAKRIRFKPGDVVFEHERTNRAYIFVGSVRSVGDYASVRLLIGDDGKLHKKANLRTIEEDEGIYAQRKQTLDDWILG